MSLPFLSATSAAPVEGAVLAIYHRSILTGAPILDADVAAGCNECANALSVAEITQNPGIGLDWRDLGDSGVLCPDCAKKVPNPSEEAEQEPTDIIEFDVTPSVVDTLYLPDRLELEIDEETIRLSAARFAGGKVAFCESCPISLTCREVTGAGYVTVSSKIFVHANKNAAHSAVYICGPEALRFIAAFDAAMGVTGAKDMHRQEGHPVDGVAVAQLAARAPFHIVLTKKDGQRGEQNHAK